MTDRLAATNDCSGLSKCSMVRAGYFEDPFIDLFFIGSKIGRRTAIINRGYYVRVAVVDHLVKNFLRLRADRKSQIISLGAGFDTLFFRLRKENVIHSGVTFIEVDQTPVVIKKMETIERNLAALQFQTGSITKSETTWSWQSSEHDLQYHLVSCDLNDLETLKFTLQNFCHVDSSISTFFLAECVLNYLKAENSDAILQYAANTFRSSIFVLYEQVCPNSGFGQFMRSHFEKIGSPLQSISKYPNVDAETQRLKDLGWEFGVAPLMSYFYYSALSDTDRRRISSLEPFDEMEIWHLKLNHYCMAIASCSKPMAEIVTDFIDSRAARDDFFIDSWLLQRLKHLRFQLTSHPFTLKPEEEVDDKAVLRRFGHASVILKSKFIVTLGGVGPSGLTGQHGRCKNLSVVELGSCDRLPMSTAKVLINQQMESMERIYATASVFGDDRVFVFGGRKAPNVLVDSAYIVQLDLSEKRIVEVSQFHFCDSTKPPSRYRHAATVVSPYHIFICGGISGSGEIFRDSWIVDVSQNKAIEVPNMPEALHSHSIVFINGQLLVSGGLSCLEDEPATGFLLFDFETQVWKKIEIPQLVPRYSHSSHVINNCVTLVGGCCVFDFFPGLTMVNLNAVQDVTEFQLSCDRPVSTVAHQSVKCENGDILVIGGGGNLFSFGTLFSPSFRVSVPIS